ncbi:uncharacterized protein J4E92_006643 [Alternaria infectoria]|uniref:uncharacterized protein n=1 Tax=Alternaria infectoria TaxID=45303 RepID=UPI00221E8A45|nr:uncharacterized protein J4E92_006643 [Alternaria infectoria]KAI4925907.1 hypothetical protein J4E92_006643 [Alternaria infectoria]
MSTPQPHPKKTGVHEAGPADPSKGKAALAEFSATMKRPADFKCFRQIGCDGICRTLRWMPGPDDEPTGIEVYDAQPMSPFLLKAYLDRHDWSQATEDRFRGFDGRNTPKEQWFNPLPGVLPSPSTKNERMAERDRFNEERRILEEKIAKGEVEAEDPGPACGAVRSNYDLSPR